MKKIFIVAILLMLLTSLSFAQITDEGIKKKSERLDQVCNLLQSKDITNKERAELLYEKSYIMLTTFYVGALRSGTEALLEAIELAPNNTKYKDFLCQVYNNLWKDRDFSDKDNISKELWALKERVKSKITKDAA